MTRLFTRAVLALGSNLGDRTETLSAAVAELVDRPEVRLRDVSPVVQTEAVGGPADQPDFLNMVLEIETLLGPYELLEHCHAVEAAHHRTRAVRWGPRTLDVDIITYGEVLSSDDRLTLPHPRAAERAFVLYPWSLMDPQATLGGVSVVELAARAADMPSVGHFEGIEPCGGKAGREHTVQPAP
ncbi:2-amino-4-hydroxy-6-hydroxymethyldihydropteridine diphosphokinase [Paenarthrobacter sp. Z7-10]|uniref:2-amino-4-hydroxy-6- hydroxymethyldihydropteridine diphosphokinase n=1 Tax=Paenarthrobacter sp. Z7-10 TaxID=2787635 RepID=UPI0022A98951|nr:2-amino-4-hydroxy-6-hydroxymethyldihydropteridine diphosphokinase [Paenarthrobacter sp. Z7-10]MCZ2401954.1 2-amino-4-hydroxy-6-hydroxymethyldihydropteridine diphosphokinase [Paenarthrobacter sp. Z7-10]